MAVVKINAIEVPEGAGPELERRFASRHGSVTSAPGFLRFELLRPIAGDNRYFVYSRWETEEHYQAWRDGRNGPGTEAHTGRRAKPVSTASALLEFEIAQSADPSVPFGAE